MDSHIYRGGIFVKTEPGNTLAVSRHVSNKVTLDNGERVQIKFAESKGTPVAQSQTDSEIIPAPPAGFYLVILALHLHADAATTVTLNSASTAISGPWPLAESGGFIRENRLIRCVAEQALTMTTGAGGNTSYSIDYIEVPLNVDIL